MEGVSNKEIKNGKKSKEINKRLPTLQDNNPFG